MRFKKCLLGCMGIGPVIGRAAGHRAHLEDLQLDPLAAQNGPGFIPIHLRFRSPGVRLGNEHLAMFQSQLLPPAPHITADAALASLEARYFRPQSIENATRRMTLLRRC